MKKSIGDRQHSAHADEHKQASITDKSTSECRYTRTTQTSPLHIIKVATFSLPSSNQLESSSVAVRAEYMLRVTEAVCPLADSGQ